MNLMKRCPECGAELKGDERLCPECGAEIPQKIDLKKHLPIIFHPLFVLGLIVILSLGLSGYHFYKKAKTKSSEEGAVRAQPASQPVSKKPAQKVLGIADKKYLEVLQYQKDLTDIFESLDAIDQEFPLERKELSLEEWQEVRSELLKFSEKIKKRSAPPGLGPCQSAMKNSLDQYLRAVNALWNFQNTSKKESLGTYRQSITLARSQKNYCLSLIKLVKKQLAPSLKVEPSELEERVFGKPLQIPPEEKKEKEKQIKEEKPKPPEVQPSQSPAPAPSETILEIPEEKQGESIQPQPQPGASPAPETGTTPLPEQGTTPLPEEGMSP